MVDWTVEALRHYPELAFFLTLSLGYLLGKLRIGSFSLGSVTGVLLAGVLVGQLGISLSPHVKQTFFLLFLFAIGYRTGPQFFQGLKSDGLLQALLTVIVGVTAFLVAWLASLLLGYDAGTGAGMLAGAMTESATIGTAGDAIAHLPLAEAERAGLANAIPVAFAVSYLVGVVAVTWFLAQMAPKLMRVDLAAACRELEERMSGGPALAPGMVSAWRRFELRAFRVAPATAGRSIAEIEAAFLPDRVFVEHLRRAATGEVSEASPEDRLQAGDVLTLAGRREPVLKAGWIGEEVEDRTLLDVPAETLDVVVAGKGTAGATIAELGERPDARGVFLHSVSRSGQELPLLPATRIERGDRMRLVGRPADVERVAATVGYADRPTHMTDMIFVGLGILLGGLIGIPALALGSIQIGLSESVGVLVGGLVFGWLRSRYPTFGRIPEPALWIFESVGLAGFIAVVGLAAGPDFVTGLAKGGPVLLLAALVVAILPHLVGVLVGHRLLKMHPGIVLGVCAGAGTATPALAAVQEVAKSRVPTLGYGISYAIGNVLLALWGTLMVALLS